MLQNTKMLMADLNVGVASIKTRQDILRVTTHKIISVYGHYPSKETRIKISKLLGAVLGMDSNLFYDTTTHEGFLARSLENARWRLPCKEQVFA
jgi:hypothetical protein